jgi:hypothetical protein
LPARLRGMRAGPGELASDCTFFIFFYFFD